MPTTLRCATLGRLLDKLLREQEHVRAAGPQRRKLKLNHVDAIVKVFAKPAVVDAGQQVTIGGRDDADVERNLLVAADGANAIFFQCPQQLGLHRHGHFTDFIQKQRAPFGL